jgi:hypothetical protein
MKVLDCEPYIALHGWIVQQAEDILPCFCSKKPFLRQLFLHQMKMICMKGNACPAEKCMVMRVNNRDREEHEEESDGYGSVCHALVLVCRNSCPSPGYSRLWSGAAGVAAGQCPFCGYGPSSVTAEGSAAVSRGWATISTACT